MSYINIDINLLNKWTIWYHKQDEPNWDKNSYIHVADIKTVLEFVKFKNSFMYLPQFLNGYYFFMKNDISPMWEDGKNRDGGCINIKVSKDIIDKSVWDVLSYGIAEELVLQDKQTINGISVVPKKYNAIIKIWNNDKSLRNVKILNSDINFFKDDEIYYRSHLDNDNFGQNSKK
jgi:hypothetical protein